MRNGRSRAAGFAYVGLMVLIALLGLVAAVGIRTGAALQRTQLEQALLNTGAQFSDALKSYADATLPGQPEQPESLQELLLDPRFPVVRRHLRKIPVDPLTGGTAWGISFLSGKSGVVGVYSLSDARPVKLANFDERFQAFEDKKIFRDWLFGPDQASIAPVEAPDPLLKRVITRTLTNPMSLVGTPAEPVARSLPPEIINGDGRRLVSPQDLQ
ncbi:type II secretion system protein [Actimicrobium sp. CCI2.3]|uniref:type II secretion system protein n=1 Tax=Actimicrobium sp. CCI2.3 TaxID=3048616 RepID=UPI002AB47686|nr:type II secretion system protein [Actimicrobium sp. CCI2.3]MDY7574742.1 type II secretion system protein [Actimicrobium sp. CCI2.3]MEB0020297.1 type II secretion system protein [Actimicrobium sp. CCI2.3]